MYNRDMVRRLALPLLAVFLVAACESREVENDLEIVDVRTGCDAAEVFVAVQRLGPGELLVRDEIWDQEA